MRNNKSLKVVMIITIISILLVFSGITYAYFSAFNNQGSTAEISFGPGKMLIEYADKSDALSLTKTNIQPSDTVLIDKTFSLTGINTTSGEGINMPYVVSIEYQSTFTNEHADIGEFLYFIRRVDTNENISCALKGMMENFPLEEQLGISESGYKYTGGYFEDWSGETYKQELAKGEFKAVSGEQVITFNLKMMFGDTRGNQDYNKGATFNGKIVINETSELAQKDTAVDKIDKKLITQDNSLYETKIFTDNTPNKNVRFTQNESLTNLTTVSSKANKYDITTLKNVNNDYEMKLLMEVAKDTSTNNLNIFGESAKIIGIFNVKNADTGEYERLLKINLVDSYSSQFDTNGTNNWETSSLMQELNSEDNLNKLNQYYNNSSSSSSSSSNPSYHKYNSYFDYDNNFEINDLTDLIANVEWDIGGLDSLNISLEDAYKQEKGLSPYTSNKKTWTGKIGLPSLTDFLYEKLGADCTSDLSTCSSSYEISFYNLTLTKDNTSTTNVYLYNRYTNLPETSQSGEVLPTFYLKKDVKFVCGDGTVKNPYAITPRECGELNSGK